MPKFFNWENFVLNRKFLYNYCLNSCKDLIWTKKKSYKAIFWCFQIETTNFLVIWNPKHEIFKSVEFIFQLIFWKIAKNWNTKSKLFALQCILIVENSTFHAEIFNPIFHFPENNILSQWCDKNVKVFKSVKLLLTSFAEDGKSWLQL